MGIRTFVAEDIPQVVDLHLRVKRGGDRTQARAYEFYFHKIFFQNPWYDKKYPSYVYQEENGNIIGFIGAIPRKMILNEESVQVVIGNHLVVQEDKRNTMAGALLIKKLFNGEQDLIISDGNKESRRIWQAAGGVVSTLYCVHWTTLLRPVAYLVSHLGKNKLLWLMMFLLKPIFKLIDLLAVKIKKSPFHLESPGLKKEELTTADFLEVITKLTKGRKLKPVYDNRSFKWLTELLINKRKNGVFKKVLVRNEKNVIIGWYLYYLNTVLVSKVVQVFARKGFEGAVFNQLVYDVWEQGASALTGRLETDFLDAIESKFTLFSRDHSISLLQSKNMELLNVILKGDAFFSLLESEWWIPFRDDEIDLETAG